MKINATFKDPDWYPDDEESREPLEECIKKYVLWREYITIEFDTETLEARVVTKEEFGE